MKLSKAQQTFIEDLQSGLYTLTGLCPVHNLHKDYGFVLNHNVNRFKNRYARFSTVKKLISLGLLQSKPVFDKAFPNDENFCRYYEYSLTDLGKSI